MDMPNRLTVLGSGIPLSSFYKNFDYRNPAGHLLEVNGKNILLDAGDGIRRKMDELKFDYYGLDTIFISHFHPDHFALDSFIQAFYVRVQKTGKLKRIDIYGPAKIKEYFIDIWNKKNIPSYEETFPGLLELSFFEYKDRVKMEIFDMAVVPIKVLHGMMDAYALRFTIDNSTLVYSGDTSYCKQIIEAAKNADLFLCEAGTNNNDNNTKGNLHLSSYQAGEIATKAHTKHIVLTHYSGKDTKKQMINEVKRSGFGGAIEVATDGQAFFI